MLGALINALRIVKKKREKLKVVMTGIGAAGVLLVRILIQFLCQEKLRPRKDHEPVDKDLGAGVPTALPDGRSTSAAASAHAVGVTP